MATIVAEFFNVAAVFLPQRAWSYLSSATEKPDAGNDYWGH
jgi:hypothetical protein